MPNVLIIQINKDSNSKIAQASLIEKAAVEPERVEIRYDEDFKKVVEAVENYIDDDLDKLIIYTDQADYDKEIFCRQSKEFCRISDKAQIVKTLNPSYQITWPYAYSDESLAVDIAVPELLYSLQSSPNSSQETTDNTDMLSSSSTTPQGTPMMTSQPNSNWQTPSYSSFRRDEGNTLSPSVVPARSASVQSTPSRKFNLKINISGTEPKNLFGALGLFSDSQSPSLPHSVSQPDFQQPTNPDQDVVMVVPRPNRKASLHAILFNESDLRSTGSSSSALPDGIHCSLVTKSPYRR